MESLLHTFVAYFSRGGAIMIPIFGVSVVAWWLGLEKLLFIRRFRGSRKKFQRDINSVFSGKKPSDTTGYAPYDELLEELQACKTQKGGRCSWDLLFREFLSSAIPELENGFATMSAWISVAPLLGLLGTVTGMIATFKVITDFGLGNPNLTAEGISVALITTQAGLTVAFPMMLFHNYLVNQSRRLRSKLLVDGETLIKRLNEVAGADDSGSNQNQEA